METKQFGRRVDESLSDYHSLFGPVRQILQKTISPNLFPVDQNHTLSKVQMEIKIFASVKVSVYTSKTKEFSISILSKNKFFVKHSESRYLTSNSIKEKPS